MGFITLKDFASRSDLTDCSGCAVSLHEIDSSEMHDCRGFDFWWMETTQRSGKFCRSTRSRIVTQGQSSI
jgi:hypothetical protein